MDTQIIDDMIRLTSWKMCNYRMRYIETNKSVVKTWAEDKQNERVLRWTNNHALVVGHAHEWKRAHITSEKTYTKN
jgi:hypothetical protein